jgi:chemosensory pili system protein ChpA (sensor histidine kinase/response regulator)
VTKQLPDPYPRQKQYMVIEMASAFLLVESVIDHFGNPPEDLEQQIVIMGGWLLDSAKGKSTSEPPAGLRADLVQKVGGPAAARAGGARGALEPAAHRAGARFVLARRVEARGPRRAGRVPAPGARRAQGARVRARGRSRRDLREHDRRLQRRRARPGGRGMDWVAEGLSSVGLYLNPCVQGREPSDQALDLFFQRFSRRVEAGRHAGRRPMSPIKLEDAERRPEPAAPAPRPEVDAELLAIFLEEAAEVLQRIEATLPVCRKQPDDLESLTTIRRGFHTLKGSGRMVGLMDLGELPGKSSSS